MGLFYFILTRTWLDGWLWRTTDCLTSIWHKLGIVFQTAASCQGCGCCGLGPTRPRRCYWYTPTPQGCCYQYVGWQYTADWSVDSNTSYHVPMLWSWQQWIYLQVSGVGLLVPRPRWTRPPRHDGAPWTLVTPLPVHLTLDPSDMDWEKNKNSSSYLFTPSATTGWLVAFKCYWNETESW